MARVMRSAGQLDLFGGAAPQAPAVTTKTTTHILHDQAAGLIHDPRHVGPLSEWSGSALSAAEAQRVVQDQSIRVLGAAFRDGHALCRRCLDARLEKRPGFPAGMEAHGFMMHVYPGKGGQRLSCGDCGAAFFGQVSR